jgi:hypothetical protein
MFKIQIHFFAAIPLVFKLKNFCKISSGHDLELHLLYIEYCTSKSCLKMDVETYFRLILSDFISLVLVVIRSRQLINNMENSVE